jgi:sRNA-binding carbon storage regulator CsrA
MKIQAGDKVVRNIATQDSGKVRLGDNAPAFVRTIRAGDKVVRDASTQDSGKVRLGDNAPVFTR